MRLSKGTRVVDRWLSEWTGTVRDVSALTGITVAFDNGAVITRKAENLVPMEVC